MRRRLAPILVVALLALAGCSTMTSPVALRRDWLDRPLAQWNTPGAVVPAAPPPAGEPATTSRCASLLRSPSGPEDRSVAERGWSLIGERRVRDAVVVVLGSTSVDGMCRPLGYQGFVFVDGRFAGTLSPVPMDARTDGAQITVNLDTPMEVRVAYARYSERDPLCCPSRTSHVTFKIETHPRGPVLVPREIVTTANPR